MDSCARPKNTQIHIKKTNTNTTIFFFLFIVAVVISIFLVFKLIFQLTHWLNTAVAFFDYASMYLSSHVGGVAVVVHHGSFQRLLETPIHLTSVRSSLPVFTRSFILLALHLCSHLNAFQLL